MHKGCDKLETKRYWLKVAGVHFGLTFSLKRRGARVIVPWFIHPTPPALTLYFFVHNNQLDTVVMNFPITTDLLCLDCIFLYNSFVFQPSLSFQTMPTSITPWTPTWNLCYLNSRKRREKVLAEVCHILESLAVATGGPFSSFPCFVCFVSFFLSHTLHLNSVFFSPA